MASPTSAVMVRNVLMVKSISISFKGSINSHTKEPEDTQVKVEEVVV